MRTTSPPIRLYRVITAWMDSDEHRDNMLNSHYTDVGFAVLEGRLGDSDTNIIVAMYGAPQTNSMATGVVLEGFHRQCQVLSLANLAQIVNVLQSVAMTEGNRMWLTPTYHVLRMHTPHLGATALPVEISGAVRAPHFVLGRTDPGQWRTELRRLPAPWAELETSRVILTVPAEVVRELDDPADYYEVDVVAGRTLTATVETTTATTEPTAWNASLEVELRDAELDLLTDDNAYPDQPASLFLEADGSDRTVFIRIERYSGVGGPYRLRIAISGAGECGDTAIAATDFRSGGEPKGILGGAQDGWFWMETEPAAARGQTSTWAFDRLPDDSAVRVMIDVQLDRTVDPNDGDAWLGAWPPMAAAAYFSYGIVTDEGIEEELAAYNPLIPEPGQLKATLFIELTSDEQMREWLPKLVGIESHVLFVLPGGGEVRCTVDPGHARPAGLRAAS